MTAGVAAVERITTRSPSPLRRLIAGPRQGWLALLLLGVMVAVVGMAIEDSRWVGLAPAGQSQTWWLPAAMVAGSALGFLLAVTGISTGASHLVAAGAGAAAILVASAGSISNAPTLLGRLQGLSESFSAFVNDVFVREVRSPETSAFLIVMGGICWTTGYFAAFNVFRRNRGTAAVVSAGLMLLVNMSITARIQYPYLVVFSFAAMLLLVRLNIVEQSVGWQRRHIGNADEVASLFLRGGAAFVAITLLGAVVLAATASSAPLAGVWRDMDDQLVNLTVQVNRLAGGVTGSTKQLSGMFGSAEPILGVWESSDEPLFTSVTSDGSAEYWRGAIYDDFDGGTWYQSERQAHDVDADENLVAGTTEQIEPDAPNRREVTSTITSIGLAGATLLAPDTPITTDRGTRVRTAGDGGPLVTIDLRDAIDPGEAMSVTSLVPDIQSDDSGLTASILAASGSDYPDWVGRYLVIQPNAIGQVTYDAAHRIYGRLPQRSRDPYHVAHAIQAFFTSDGGFSYSTDVRGVCGRQSVVDCLLAHKVGYCQHYASAMTMMLRVLGIPARFVEGYLPGRLMADGVTREVDKSAAHAWVEVYFPDFGWLRFEPTPGNDINGRELTTLPVGEPIVDASPLPVATPDEAAVLPTLPPVDAGGQPPPVPVRGEAGSLAPYAVAGLVVAAVFLAFFARRRRRPGLTGDQTFDRVARLAARVGYAPRPSQTTFEYAGALSEVVPGLRQELHVVANAKVESTYGRRLPTGTALAALHHAYGRIRRGLVRLWLRPKRKRPADRGPTART